MEKNAQKLVESMSLKDRKKLSSNDMIERMIRIEQRVAASFGERIPYNETYYFKSLSSEKKKEFENYLKNKNKRKTFFVFTLVIPFLLAVSFRFGFTGRIIQENFGESASAWLSILFVAIILIVIFVAFTNYLLNRKKNKKYNQHFRVLENIIGKRV